MTRSPTDEWVGQLLREATPDGQTPRFLIRDRDGKYGEVFARVAKGGSIEIVKTRYRAPRANAICERFLGSVKRECMDHQLILTEGRLYRVIKEYVAFFNVARPYEGINQKIPGRNAASGEEKREGTIIGLPVLNALHNDYRRAA